MRSMAITLLAASAMACVALPPSMSYTNRPTDAVLLGGDWRGDFSSEDGQRSGSIVLTLAVKNDTARGQALLMPVVYVAAEAGASVPMRAETSPIIQSSMHFVSVTDGVVTGVTPVFFDAARLTMVQMTFVGRLRSWNLIEGTYVALGPNLRIEERGIWRVVRGK